MIKLTRNIVTITFLLVLWWILSIWVNKTAFPAPHLAFIALVESFQNGLIEHSLISLYRVCVSMLFATILAVPLGLFFGKNPNWDERAAPLIYLTYPIPKVVFMPILFVLFGIGEMPKLVLIFLVVFYQILVTTRDAAKGIDKAYVLSVKSLGAGSWQLYRHVYFPGSLPKILTALRIGLGTAMAVLFLTETFATRQGLGYMIMDAQARMDYGDMFAAIIAMGSIGFILYLLLDQLEKFICKWANL